MPCISSGVNSCLHRLHAVVESDLVPERGKGRGLGVGCSWSLPQGILPRQRCISCSMPWCAMGSSPCQTEEDDGNLLGQAGHLRRSPGLQLAHVQASPILPTAVGGIGLWPFPTTFPRHQLGGPKAKVLTGQNGPDAPRIALERRRCRRRRCLVGATRHRHFWGPSQPPRTG
eukprot:scaffold268_cov236-Pinguiococcus_pyrenoidosus.AAC.11